MTRLLIVALLLSLPVQYLRAIMEQAQQAALPEFDGGGTRDTECKQLPAVKERIARVNGVNE